jgi:hypothetical protein
VPLKTPLVVAFLLLAAALTPSATAVQAKRADLKITAGDVAVSGARVTGSFTVRNKGTKRAPATSTAVKVDGKRVRSVATGAVGPGRARVVRFSARVGGGTHVISVCADRRNAVAERREGNNCRKLGTVTVESTSVPSNPIPYDDGVVFKVGTSPHEYWLHVPTSYDDSHRTPIRLVVFVHGCGSLAYDQATNITDQVDGAKTNFIVMAPGLGKDGQCWDPTADVGPLLGAVADVKTHFNIDPKRVVVGGYSSGSTLAGQVAFRQAELFAGLLVLPGRPFWSNENRDELLADAAWKINVAWRPHTSDEYYPIASLRADRRVMLDAGYPLLFSEVAGGHSYTNEDLNYLFGKIGGWTAP